MIRVAQEQDAAAVLDIYTPAVLTTAISFEVEPPSLVAMQQRIQTTLQTHPWLVYEHDGGVVGYAYASAHRSRAAYQWSTDVSVYIHPSAHRRGIGRALYTSLLTLLRLQGFYNAYAGIALPNAGSVGLHEAMGFQPIGVYRAVGYKFGVWHDVGWWELAVQPKLADPAPPLPFPQATTLPQFASALGAGMQSPA